MNSIEVWEKVKHINPHYAISPQELEFIIRHALLLPEEPTILELGVCHGRTFAAMTSIAGEKNGIAFGIDHFRMEGAALNVRASLQLIDLDHYTLLVQNTHDVKWNRPIDLLIVDAGHDEDNVKVDVEKYVPFVKPGGYVFFDDYDEPANPESAHWAVRHYADAACSEWQDLGIVEGVRGWRRPL